MKGNEYFVSLLISTVQTEEYNVIVNTLGMSDANLRFYITTVQDG
jgi:hypothetical protein